MQNIDIDCNIDRVANFKRNLLRDYWAESINFGAHLQAEILKFLKLYRTFSISASNPEIWVFKHKRSVFSQISPVYWVVFLKAAAILPHQLYGAEISPEGLSYTT